MRVDYLCLLRFNEQLRKITASEFIDLLHKQLQACVVVVGHDFRFGRHGAADALALEHAGGQLGFTVSIVPPVLHEGVRISSSDVREALREGRLDRVAALLGRPYSMIGRVITGRSLGRELGYPTANIRMNRKRIPLFGIYAVRVCGVGAEPRAGVASLGTRPTLDGTEPLLEAHVFDFSGDLYGREIEVQFVQKIREELRFETLDALVARMRDDERVAREILAAA
jgi:riboflavin kinase/FMN adenylyltransferase